MNAQHQGTSKQQNEVQLFTHTVLNAFLTFRAALVPNPLGGSCGTVLLSIWMDAVVLMGNLAVGNTYTIIIYVQGGKLRDVKSVKKVLKKKGNQCKQ